MIFGFTRDGLKFHVYKCILLLQMADENEWGGLTHLFIDAETKSVVQALVGMKVVPHHVILDKVVRIILQ